MALQPVRFETAGPMLIAGHDQYYSFQERGGIAGQWSAFDPMPQLSVECAGYGVCHRMDARGFRYFCGVRVGREDGLPEGVQVLRLPAQRYAVFVHRGHVATLWQTCDAVGRHWLPTCGLLPARDPVMLERYDNAFDPRTGMGEVEVWLALRDGAPPARK
jgi:AraC family transcriptional regulator